MTDEGGLLRPLDLLASGANLVGDSLHAATVLGRARLIRPLRPDRPPRALAAVQRWGFTPAGGFAAAAALYPDAEAVVDERGALTFAELEDRTSRLANALSDAGVLEGDGVGVMCRNHRGFVEAIVALSKLGANAMLLNTAFAGPQLTEVVKREKPRAIIYDAEFAELLSKALYRRKGFVAWRDEGDEIADATLDELIEGGDPVTPLPPEREGRQTILTSGTTGTPKGASRGSPGIGAAVAILSAIPLRGREKVLIAPPLFHQWGFAHFGLAMLTASTMVLRRKFDPENILETIERERIDTLPMVPVMLQRLLELDDETRRGFDTDSLRIVPVSRLGALGRPRPPLHGRVRRGGLQPLRLDRGRVGRDRLPQGPARGARHRRPPAPQHRARDPRRRRPSRPRRARPAGSSSRTRCSSRAIRAAARRTWCAA